MKANDLLLIVLLTIGFVGCAVPHNATKTSLPASREPAKPVIQANPKADLKVDMTPGMIVLGRAIQRRDFFEALNLIQSELKTEQARLKPRWVQVSYLKLMMGRMLGELGRHEEALDAFSAAQVIWLRRLGAEHERIAYCYVHMGVANKFLGRLAKARKQNHNALAIQLKTYGPMDSRVVMSLNEIGLLHFESGEFKKARAFHAGALAILIAVENRDISLQSSLRNNLAAASARSGDYAQAMGHFEWILNALQKSNQPEHQWVGAVYLKMALNLARQIEPDFERAHELTDLGEGIFLKIGDPKLYPGYEQIVRGQIFYRQKLYPKAIEAFIKAEKALLEQSGEKDSKLGRVYFFHGLTHVESGEDQQARKYFEKALAIQIKSPGPESFKTVETQAALAALKLKEK